MYVEKTRDVVTSPVQQKVQNAETENINHAESTEGKQELTAHEYDIESKSATAAELQSAEMEKLKKVMEKISEQLPHSEAKFGIHEATNRVMIKLVDKDTQEVIKEIPPEKTLDLLAKSLELAGVLVDQKL